MRSTYRTTLATLICLALAGSQLPRAEVSARKRNASRPQILSTSIVEEADPFGKKLWQPFNNGGPGDELNPQGHSRGDGRPHLVLDPNTDFPKVVWAYWAGTDYDIAFVEWTNQGWGPITFISRDTINDVDPRLFVAADGTAHVVYTSRDRIHLASRGGSTLDWSDPVTVSPAGEKAGQPTVVEASGGLHVAYVRSLDRDGITAAEQQLVGVVRTRTSGFFGAPTLIAATGSTPRMEPMLHAVDDTVWVEWVHGAGEMGWSSLEANGFSTPQRVELSEGNWVGVESTRKAIRVRVLAEDLPVNDFGQ